MFYDKDEIKEQLTIEQVSEIVIALGSAPPIMMQGRFMMENLCHHLPGQSHECKLYYYDNTKLLRCYTKCRESFDIFQLVQKAMYIQYNEDWVLPKAVEWVAKKVGVVGTVEGFDGDKVDDWKMINHYVMLQNKIETAEEKGDVKLAVYDNLILAKLSLVPIERWMQEGITIEAMTKYGIKYYPKDHKIVIPHWDEDSNLIGIRGRSLVKQEAELFGKYTPIKINGIMYNHPLSFALYGLNFNKNNIRKAKKAIVFEGEKSVMLYESLFGAENNIAVASCGSSISMHQFGLLRALDIDELVIAYDRQFMTIGDEEFKIHIRTLKQLAKRFNNYVTVTLMHDVNGLLDYKDAPIDKGREVFEELFKRRIIMR